MTKTRKTTTVSVLVVLTLLLAGGSWCLLSAPFIWYDKQGAELASFLDSDMDIPPSKTDANRREVFAKGRAYLTLTGWKKGSEVLVYGVITPSVQERIIARAQNYVRERHLNRVVIEFYPERVFIQTGANVFELVKAKPLRSTSLTSD